MSLQSFRFQCRNPQCSHEFIRQYSIEEFDKIQYKTGFNCWDCGFPKMLVGRSMKRVQDAFKPGWQGNIDAYCSTYSQYKQILKERGLEEIGNEEFVTTRKPQSFWNESLVRKIKERGVMQLSDREADVLIEKGAKELLKDGVSISS